MADAAESPGPEGAPDACRPCRGTGSVRSGAGGTPHTVPCPWCEGTGLRIEGHDAQAARRGAGDDGASVPAADVD